MKFDQTKTVYAQAVDFAVDMFENQRGSCESAKLMIILSDGTGVYTEGETIVKNALRRARMQNILLMFIIIENPANKVTFNFLFIIVFLRDFYDID